MTLKEQIHRFEALYAWFHTPHGSYVAEVIQEELMHLNEILRGETLIQLGGSVDNAWLVGLKFTYKWLFNPQINPEDIHCSSMMNVLPLDRESIDCVVAPFTGDAFQGKEPLLDEIDRVLKPMGHVVFIGVNPLSLWGWWLCYASQSLFGEYQGHPKSPLAIQRPLIHRNYLQCYYNGFYFIPPVTERKWINSFAFLNQVGKMISPCPSAFYCLVMQKQVENYIAPICVDDKKDLLKDSPAYQPVC